MQYNVSLLFPTIKQHLVHFIRIICSIRFRHIKKLLLSRFFWTYLLLMSLLICASWFTMFLGKALRFRHRKHTLNSREWIRHYLEEELSSSKVTIFIIKGLSSKEFADYFNRDHDLLRANNQYLDKDNNINMQETEKYDLPKKLMFPTLKWMAKQGVLFSRVLTAFPSVSNYGIYPLLSGKPASQSMLLGENKFRRKTTKLFRGYNSQWKLTMPSLDLNPDHSIILEELYHNTTTINYPTRGTLHSWFSSDSFRMKHALNLMAFPEYKLFDHRTSKIAENSLIYNDTHNQIISFEGAALYRQAYGKNEQYEKILRSEDALIQKHITNIMETNNEKDRLFIFTSDHGLTSGPKQYIGIESILDSQGIKATQAEKDYCPFSMLFPKRHHIRFMSNYDAAITISGNRMAHIYFQRPDVAAPHSWRTEVEPSQVFNFQPINGGNAVDLVSSLKCQPGIKYVIVRSVIETVFSKQFRTGGVEIHSCDGIGFVNARFVNDDSPETMEEFNEEEKDEDDEEHETNAEPIHENNHPKMEYMYTLLSGQDPLNYLQKDPNTGKYIRNELFEAVVSSKYQSPEKWLSLTQELPLPNAHILMHQSISIPEGSDMMLVTESEHAFYDRRDCLNRDHQASHGSANQEETTVPFIIFGKGVSKRGWVHDNMVNMDQLGNLLFTLLDTPSCSTHVANLHKENQEFWRHYFDWAKNKNC
eukprot:gb/GECH01013676.1/.p1 GENE.gb/GECH01013676.1/~~gb/GECH01013676.1/.p1  ORF type:complete len:703 (+),score=159.11 gb/GECH01013676.1/:1-2109(+)